VSAGGWARELLRLLKASTSFRDCAWGWGSIVVSVGYMRSCGGVLKVVRSEMVVKGRLDPLHALRPCPPNFHLHPLSRYSDCSHTLTMSATTSQTPLQTANSLVQSDPRQAEKLYNHILDSPKTDDEDALRDQEDALMKLGELYRDEAYVLLPLPPPMCPSAVACQESS
jgi:hypothetical protein